MLAGLAVALSLLAPVWLAAQDLDDGDTPLGDVARNFRKQLPPSQQEIIDNDNLTKVMDDVDSHRIARSSLMYSIDGPGKAFQVSAPDVTCSLSFSANVKALLASSYVQMELPADQLLKLSGPAAIHGDSLEASIFNGTQWHVSELAVALTVVRRSDFPEASLRDQSGRDQPRRDQHGNDGLAKVIPAAAIEPLQEPGNRSDLGSDGRAGKRPDTAVLYRMRAAAPPFGVTVFAAPLNVEIGPDQEWHWAIVQAKGYPPQQNLSEPNAATEGATTLATQPEMGQPMTPAPETPIPAAPLQPNLSQGATTQPSLNAPAR
ncbi:MAG: hypothetical protein WAN60_00810 [Candidatus Sulfotelmatobacter sp.]